MIREFFTIITILIGVLFVRGLVLENSKRSGSIIFQVGVMFVVCILLTGGITFVTQYYRSTQDITEQMSTLSESISDEVKHAVIEYPAHEWLIKYWFEHADELEIEYDAGYTSGTETEEKCRLLESHCPDLQLRYADAAAIEALSEEDQKLYAEIIYSWLITRLDQIKESNNAKFLYCVQPNEAYDTQFFLFSAATSEEKRGTEGEDVYPLGYTKDMTDKQRASMKDAEVNASNFTDVDGYIDYYSYLGNYNGRPVFIGLTTTETELTSALRKLTAKNSLAAMGYQIILAIICSIGILYLVLKPLKKVQGSIRQYKQSKDSSSVTADLKEIKSKNEIGDLAEDVIELAHEIDDYVDRIQHITAEKERIVTELALAEEIQVSMLPRNFPPFPDRHEFDIYAVMDPAREVGGDFYDFFLIDDDHLCLVIADVSGKGIPAALFMMSSMIIIKNCTVMGMSPSEILETANDSLFSHNEAEMFVTVWIGILEISSGKLTAANAGHEYPTIKKPGGSYELFKDKHGFVVGGMEGLKYKEYEMQLEPGTSIFVYTDGVPESTNKDEVLFGTDRMIEALNSEPDACPEKVLANMRESIDAFVLDAEQFDDLTMLCIQYNGA